MKLIQAICAALAVPPAILSRVKWKSDTRRKCEKCANRRKWLPLSFRSRRARQACKVLAKRILP